MERDKKIFSLINDELHRQTVGIELIASENFTSKQVMEAMGSCLTNKYAEGYPQKRYYGGCELTTVVCCSGAGIKWTNGFLSGFNGRSPLPRP